MGDDATFGILAFSVAQIFGSEAVSPELATALSKVLPDATFVRASIRCGTGLFVTDDLLRAGHSMVSLVSLKYSLAGLAMKRAEPLTVRLPAGSSSFGASAPTRLVACVPVAVAPPPGADYRPLQVGAILVGSAGELSERLKTGMARLAAAAGPALLTVGLTQVQHLGHLLALRDADAEYVGAEEDLQDLPLEVSRPHPGPDGPPAQSLRLSSVPEGREENQGNGTAPAPSKEPLPAAATTTTSSKELIDAEEDAPELEKKNTEEREVEDAALADATDAAGEPTKAQFFRDQGTASSSGSLDELKEVESSENAAAATWAARVASCGCPAGKLERAPSGRRLLLGPLLIFEHCPSLESAFIAWEADSHAPADAAFCAVFLAAVAGLLWASGPVHHPPAWAALALAAALPLAAAIAALRGARGMYARCREALLCMLLLVTALCARRGGPLEGAVAVLDGAVEVLGGGLPCLLRAADLTLAVAVPLGCRVRFCFLLPGQAVNLWSIARAVPWEELGSTQCRSACAATLAVAGVLPLIVAYATEARARRKLQTLVRRFTPNTPPAPQPAAANGAAAIPAAS